MTYDKTDISVGVYPYNVQVTADGRFALTANQGNGGAADGGAGSVTVIDLKATPPHVVDYVGIDPLPEGLDVSPRGNLAVALALNGSGAVAKGAWYRASEHHRRCALDRRRQGAQGRLASMLAGLPKASPSAPTANISTRPISWTATCRFTGSPARRSSTPARP